MESRTEIIKPSTPTPMHLKTFKLSRLQQLASFYEYSSPVVLFYAAPLDNNNNILTISRLKDSLAKALSIFYPLAGRLSVHEPIIECNDEGVPVVVARHNKCSLLDYLGSSNRVDLVPQFIPREEVFLDPKCMEMKGFLVPVAFQITDFKCGGVSIGAQILQCATDATGFMHFLNTWASINALGGCLDQVIPPDFTSCIPLFPSSSELHISPTIHPWVLQPLDQSDYIHHRRTCIVRAFEFDARSIAALQFKGRSECVPNPTRVESVTCFLWKHLMATAAAALHPSLSDNSGDKILENISLSLIHSVNMRPHLRPPIPKTSFRNAVTHAFTHLESKDDRATIHELPALVAKLRTSFVMTKDTECMAKYQGVEGVKTASQHKQELAELFPIAYFFVTWKGYEEVNFGSGVPVWIGVTGGRHSYAYRNYIPLVHNPGSRFQAWLILDEKEMSILESDSEFLAYATPVGSAGSVFSPKPSL